MVEFAKILSHMPIGGNGALWKLRHEAEDDRFLRIFGDFARLIRNSEKACEKAEEEDEPDYRDLIIDEECDYLEELIGSSFVVLQAKIRRVTEASLALRDVMRDQHQIDLISLADVKTIRALCGNYGTTNTSLVQLVWDVANYYKHRDEWDIEVWEDAPPDVKKDPLAQSRQTRRSVQRAGIKPNSTGDLRNAYSFFGIEPYSKCVELAKHVQSWAAEVYKTGHAQLKAEVATRKNPRQ